MIPQRIRSWQAGGRGYVLAAAVLTTWLLTLPVSSAGFSDVTANAANVLGSEALDPATGLSATGGASISLSWTATVDTYADGHRVLRATSSGGPYTAIAIATVTPRTTTTYIDAPPAGTYYYVVRAYAGNWESLYSNEDSATAAVLEDYDAVAAGVDNCPTTFNIDQFDTDGDGDGDACDASPTAVSTGTFTDSGQSLSNNQTERVAVGDVDGDGDLDVMAVNYQQGNLVWLNSGGGSFLDSGQSLGSQDTLGVAFGDVDGDGDLDAMTTNFGQANKVWLNNGSGTFTDSGQSLGSNKLLGRGIG